MKLDADQLKVTDTEAGMTSNGTPIYYFLSKGGLHMFLAKNQGKMQFLAAAPHIGIARYFAEKKADSPVKWSQDYMLKSETAQDTAEQFHQMRKVFFSGVKLSEKPAYCVYNHNNYEFELMDKSEFKSSLAKKEYGELFFVRRMDREEKPVFITDFKEE